MRINDFFAIQLKKSRSALGLTQKQLADIICYSDKSVSKWETGEAVPTAETLVLLSKVLNVTVDTLIVEPDKVRYFLGIDGGGTKTKFRLCDSTGKILEETVRSASNPSIIGFEKSIEVLKSGIEEICANYPCNCISLFAGLSGLTRQNKKSFMEFFRTYPFSQVDADQDIVIISAAGIGKADGIVAIMGTGSVVRCNAGGEGSTIGGWGAFFDNGGSGFRLGRDAILAALRDIDGSGEHTALTELVREKLGMPANEALSEFYKLGATYIASFSYETIQAAKESDKVAVRIVNENAAEMARLIDMAAKKISGKTIPVVFAGGLCTESDFLFPLIKKAQQDKRRFEYKVLDKDPVHGAVLMAGLINVENEERES